MEASLGRTISQQLEVASGRVLTRYLGAGDVEVAVLTGQDIDRRARRAAAGLRERGLVGRRVLIVLETGPGFLEALLGCLYAGVVAVPAPEPRPGALLDRLEGIATAGGVAAVVTSAQIAASLRGRAGPDSPLAAAPVLDIETLGVDEAGPCAGLDARPQDAAIIQYTSGSTGAPRGVVLTHGCLSANIEMQTRGMSVGQPGVEDVLVNWMPHFHDLGLVGKTLTPLVKGLEVVNLSPLAFVQRPARWLKAISRYRATVSGAPAFAFDLCAERIPDAVVDELDLSSWRVAFCGAEPVFAATLESFRRRFARAGFRPESLFTCYGLAETTLYAAGGARPEAVAAETALPPTARAPCYLDAASRGTIRIVGEDGRPAGEGEEGEIWIAGPSVADGYLDDPEATEATFGGRLNPDDGRRWLRTGDLGRVAGDVLIVTGRIKDVLISGGVNVAAADVERYAVRGLPQLNPHAAAAVQGPDELGAPVALLAERRRRAGAELSDAEIERRIRGAVFDALGLGLDVVRLLPPGALPRTTSGKIRRRAAAALLAGPPEPRAAAS